MVKPGSIISKTLKKCVRDTSGQIAVMAAVSMSAVMTAVAVGVDTTATHSAKTELQNVADAIALAAVRDDVQGSAALKQYAETYIANHYTRIPAEAFKVNAITREGDNVSVDLSQSLNTPFSSVLAGGPIALRATSTANQFVRNLDISLVLDNTGSMRGAKLAALKDASHDLVDILYANEAGKKGTQIGLVPFASWVNVGRDQARAGWMDQSGLSGQNRTYFDRNVSRFDLYDQMGKSWDGCVENRLPPYDIDDTPADPSKPETLFQPAFHPDMSDLDHRGYSYVLDTSAGNAISRLRGSDKYSAALDSGVEGPARRADNSCNPRRKVTPLTKNERKIRTGIDNMYASGWTNIANGASWGFRLVSPHAPFTEGRPYTDLNTDKAMVILTDGMQTMGGDSGASFQSGYSPFGFLGEPAIDGKTRMRGGNVKQALDNKLVEICAAAKAKDIIIYSITFELDDKDTQDVMRACASDKHKYFDVASAAELSPAFREIAASLSELRLSH